MNKTENDEHRDSTIITTKTSKVDRMAARVDSTIKEEITADHNRIGQSRWRR
jgi:hypothetical protein